MGSMLWIAVAGVVGLVAITVVLHIQDRTGTVPPTSTFAAAGIAISVVAIVTVALAAHAAGTTWRARDNPARLVIICFDILWEIRIGQRSWA